MRRSSSSLIPAERRRMIRTLIILYFSTLLPLAISGQTQVQAVMTNVPQECIYLQTDKPYYTAGDTVWFRAHLVDTETYMPVSRSRFVYVEMHDQQADTLIQRLIVRCDSDGVFANALPLPKEIQGGVYTLVAYTQWMRNFPAEQFCYQPLTVLGGKRVRGHRIPEQHLSHFSAEATINGNASTSRALMTLDIDVCNQDGQPLPGIYALSVTDYDLVKPDSLFGDIRQSLLRQQHSRQSDTLTSITYPYEEEQFITGRIKGTWRSKIKNPHLLVVNSQTGQRHEFELGDSMRFALAVDNPEGSTFLLEVTNRHGGTNHIQLLVDTLTFPQPQLPQYALSSIATDSATLQRISQLQSQSSFDGILLDEVVKIGTHRPIKSSISHLLGAPSFMLTEGHPKLQATRSVEILLRTLGVKHDGVTKNGNPRLHARIFIIGDRQSHERIPLSLIPPSEIKQLDFYRGFKYEPDFVVIQLKPGAVRRILHKPNMVAVQQMGYSQPVDFYSPQYTESTPKTRPDFRTTLYWNPKVQTDHNGHATVHFCASDISRRYLVTLEGVSHDGIIVHKQVIIE